MNASAIRLLVSSVLLWSIFAAEANAAVIDFEQFNLGGGLFLDVGSPLVFPNVSGSGVTVSINEGADNRIYDLVLFGGTYPGPGRQALIDWNWSTFQNVNGTDIVFSSPVSDFSLIAGDYGSDDDTPLRIEAFDQNNVSLGVAAANWPSTANPPFALLSLNVSGISRVHYSSGGSSLTALSLTISRLRRYQNRRRPA